MARATWSGAISFGLVNIPVKLYTATARRTVRFNQIDTQTGSRVRQRKVSEASGEEVAPEDIAKGYELASGQYVIVTEDELAALDPEASRTIDLIEFVDQDSIDPIYYDAGYYLAPDKATTKPYVLFLQALMDSDKVGIARFVMRGKEYLCAIRAQDGKLVLSTMLYADEVRSTDDIPELEAVEETEVTEKEVAMAAQLIASLDGEFDPSAYHDTHRDKVMDLIERKASGDDGLVESPAPVESDKVIDLMAALEASVAEAKKARGRHPTGRSTPSSDDEGSDEGPAKKSSAKKSGARKAAAKKTPAKKASARKAGAKKTGTRKSA